MTDLLIISTWLLSAVEPAPRTLRTQCLIQAAEPSNPWALAHGMTAFGAAFVAKDGRLAADVIVEDFLEKQVGTKQTGQYSFNRFSPDGTPIEPHPNLLIKTMVLARIPMSRTFRSRTGNVQLKDLIASAQQGFVHSPQVEGYWREVGWTLDLMAATLKPGTQAVFTNAMGQPIDFNSVMNDALSYLERAQQDLSVAMAEGRPRVEKRKQGIYSHPCGGLHLVQAVFSWARHASVRKQWAQRLEHQRDILLYRLESESQQYDEAEREAPQYRLNILTQKLKFYGHFLETMGRIRQETAWVPDTRAKKAITKAQTLLNDTTAELKKLNVFNRLESLQQSHRQIYLDLIGDACHAVNGLEYWK